MQPSEKVAQMRRTMSPKKLEEELGRFDEEGVALFRGLVEQEKKMRDDLRKSTLARMLFRQNLLS